MTTPAFINDGYTAEGYLAAEDRLHPELRFKYRPMLVADRSVLNQASAKEPDVRKQESLFAQAMASRIVEWNLEKPPTLDNMLRLVPALWDKLFSVIAGARPSDDDPLATEADREHDADESLQAALEGKPLEAVRAGN